MKRLESSEFANRRAATSKRLAVEIKIRASGLRVTGWKAGKPKVRKQAGSRT